jgi:hypothetical protein
MREKRPEAAAHPVLEIGRGANLANRLRHFAEQPPFSLREGARAKNIVPSLDQSYPPLRLAIARQKYHKIDSNNILTVFIILSVG